MYIGVDIGGSKILVAARHEHDKQLILSEKFETPADAEIGLRLIIARIEELCAGRPIAGIAVVAPGPMDFQNGVLLTAHYLPWHYFPLRERLHRYFNCPIILEHDASAAAWAEYQLGVAKGLPNVAYLTISTGIGTGLVLNGAIYHGRFDSEGGDIPLHHNGSHWTHLEDAASGRAIRGTYGHFAFDITDDATWRQIALDLAQGIGALAALLSPDIIVIGGGVSVHWNRFAKPLKANLTDMKMRYPLPPIVPSKWPELNTVTGAVLLAEMIPKS
jgi:predicted NBD/HSP70 family sugar kinase